MWNDVPLLLPDEAATVGLARWVAPHLKPGDVLLISGPIGAGKSALCRAIIRALCGDDTEVPSPTFTIVQPYDTPAGALWHCDLYRLGDVQEVVELGLDEAFDTAICLIEWPDRLGDLTPPNALHLRMQAGPDAHQICAHDGSGHWQKRLGDYHG